MEPVPPETIASNRLVRIRTYASALEANLAKLRLESEGLFASLAGETRAAGLGTYGAISDGVDLMVRESDLAIAQEMLGEVESNRKDRLAGENPSFPGVALSGAITSANPPRASESSPRNSESESPSDRRRRRMVRIWLWIAIAVIVAYLIRG
jgi:hypothetical protein